MVFYCYKWLIMDDLGVPYFEKLSIQKTLRNNARAYDIYIYMLSPPKLYHFLVFLAVVTICAQFQPEGNICVVIKPCEKELGRYFILACKMHGFATTKLSLRIVKQNIFVMSFVGCPTSFFLALTRNNFRTLCRGRMQSSTIHAVS